MKSEAGPAFSFAAINLAELERRTGVSRSKLRRLKRNGFEFKPHGNKGRTAQRTVLTGYTEAVDAMLRSGIANSSICLERLREAGYSGGVSAIKDYIAAHRDLIPAKRQLVAPQGNRGRRYTTLPGEAFQMDWGFVKVQDYLGNVFMCACFAMICHHCGVRYIKSYVEKDPTAFCTYDEFETGVAALRTFCEKRNESIRGQLDGTIPSTDAGQRADSSALVDASEITISSMGSMGGGFPGDMGDPGSSAPKNGNGPGERPDGGDTGSQPSGQGFPGAPEGFQPGEEQQSSENGGERPFGFPGAPSGGQNGGMPDFPGGSGGEAPGGFSGGDFPGGSSSGSTVAQQDWIMLAACAVVLCLGIVFVKKYHVA